MVIEPRDVTATIRPEDFVTDFDKTPPADDPNYRQHQYESALKMAREGATIYIARNGTWSAKYDGASVFSYEKLGYHRDTDALVRGWLDGGARIYDYRDATPDPTPHA